MPILYNKYMYPPQAHTHTSLVLFLWKALTNAEGHWDPADEPPDRSPELAPASHGGPLLPRCCCGLGVAGLTSAKL